MSQDNPDTVLIVEETSRWATTQVEDVFLPGVRVQLGWADVEDAVANGAVVPAEAHSLWATWAMPGAPTRVANLTTPTAFPGEQAPDSRPAPAAQARRHEGEGAPGDASAPAARQGDRPGVVWLLGGLVVGLVLGCGLTYLALT